MCRFLDVEPIVLSQYGAKICTGLDAADYLNSSMIRTDEVGSVKSSNNVWKGISSAHPIELNSPAWFHRF